MLVATRHISFTIAGFMLGVILMAAMSRNRAAQAGDQQSTAAGASGIVADDAQLPGHRRRDDGKPLYAFLRTMAPFVYPQLHDCLPGESSSSPPAPAVDSTALTSYSQGAEDVTLWRRFFEPAGVRHGTFLEIGGLDGVGLSNTLMFEEQLGWRGLLVEAVPGNSVKLAHTVRTRRQRSVAFTLGSCGDAALENVIAPAGRLTVTGAGPTAATVVADAAEHLQTFGLGNGQMVNVACVPLQAMVEASGLLDINLFSLDVEGAEALVLQGLDFERTNIQLVLVENNELNEGKNERVRALLAAAGFERGFDVKEGCPNPLADCMRNEVFVNPQFEARRDARVQPVRYHAGTGVPCADSESGGGQAAFTSAHDGVIRGTSAN
jgi:FkbM family methyltransferase